MLFQTYGDRRNPAVLFFHAMGVTGASSEPVCRKYFAGSVFCIYLLTVYCEGQNMSARRTNTAGEDFCIDRAWSGWRWWSLLLSAQTLPWRF